MGKISEFTEKDYEVIARDYADLKEAAKKRCADQYELDQIQKAFEFANEAHKGVRRRSGEPYILHPIAVAKIVVSNIGLGYKSIIAALLHDVVEDTDYTVEDLSSLFGEKVATLVEGLTKIKTVLDNEDKAVQKSMQAENFKRILLTLNDDVRVVLIKLADRLHNCRTKGIRSSARLCSYSFLSPTASVCIASNLKWKTSGCATKSPKPSMKSQKRSTGMSLTKTRKSMNLLNLLI